MLYPAVQLQAYEPLLSHRSATAYPHSGCWGVAGSTTLALACQAAGHAELLLPRRVMGPEKLAIAG